MAFLNKPVCDGCGVEKREANRWFCVKADSAGFRAWPWHFVTDHGNGYEHFCGQSCSQKRFERWMNEQVTNG